MSWFSDRYEDYQEEAKRLDALESNAGLLFDQVWQRVLAIATEASATGLSFVNDATEVQRTLTMQSSQSAARTLALTMDLAPDKRVLKADSDAGCQQFAYAVDGNYEVSLSLNNEVLTPQQVAEKIMESFLFHGSSPYAVHVKRVE